MPDDCGGTIILQDTTTRITMAIRGILQSILATGIIPTTLAMVIMADITPVVMAMVVTAAVMAMVATAAVMAMAVTAADTVAVMAEADTVRLAAIANPAGTWSVRQLSDDGEGAVCYGGGHTSEAFVPARQSAEFRHTGVQKE